MPSAVGSGVLFPGSAPFELVRAGDRDDEPSTTGVNAVDFENAAIDPRNSGFDRRATGTRPRR